MNVSSKWILAAIAAAVLGAVGLPTIADSTSAPASTSGPAATASAPASQAAAVRDEDDIMTDLQSTSRQLMKVMRSPREMLDETQRAELAPKVLPLFKKMVGLINELMPVMDKKAPDEGMTPAEHAKVLAMAKASAKEQILQMEMFMSVFGDKAAADAIDVVAKSDDKTVALRGKVAQNVVAWWRNAKDEKAQEKVLETMTKLAEENPKDDQLVEALMTMKNMGAASEAVGNKAVAIINDKLNGNDAEEFKAKYLEDAKLREAIGKPIELAAKTVGGKDFSSKEYKGKVVLVDFWATWCGPCIAELPHVKEVYKKYHEKGLEIVGVSCDSSGDALVKFTAKEEMPWVQLWDESQAKGQKWHALATKWKVEGIPTMFLIDKDGILRTMEARENMDEMIPKLLEEKEGAKAAESKPAESKPADSMPK